MFLDDAKDVFGGPSTISSDECKLVVGVGKSSNVPGCWVEREVCLVCSNEGLCDEKLPMGAGSSGRWDWLRGLRPGFSCCDC